MMRRVGGLLVMVCLPMLAACGNNDPAPIPGGSVTIPEATAATVPGASSDSSGAGPASVAPNPPSEADESTGPAGADLPAKPGRDQCVTIAEAPDGRYQVYDAGTAVVLHTGNRLEINRVAPAAGWTDRIDGQSVDEVKIEFTKGRTQLNLEIEIDDGQFGAQICNDEDDD